MMTAKAVFSLTQLTNTVIFEASLTHIAHIDPQLHFEAHL
jgi:hypothetical protein